MPLYEYQCEACGRFEKIVKFSDPPLETCPECGGAVQKLLSSPAIQFKGSGWYITDYAKKASSDGSGSSETDKGTGKSSETGETAKSDTAKSDTKSDSPPAPAATTSKE